MLVIGSVLLTLVGIAVVSGLQREGRGACGRHALRPMLGGTQWTQWTQWAQWTRVERMMSDLSSNQAFLAMSLFIEAYRARNGMPDELGALLGSLAIRGDGVPADAVVRADWLDAVRRAGVAGAGTTSDGSGSCIGVVAIRDAEALSRFPGEGAGARCVELEGDRARDLSSFHVEVARALDFPSYYGANLNALIDCMRDEYVKSDAPMTLWINNAWSLIADDDGAGLHALLASLTFIAEEWWHGIDSIAVEAPYRRRLLMVLDYSAR